MPDPLSPSDIARRTFDVARRGYEQQEVRGFLHEVSALVERLVRPER
jgi:DivIVA domain-containing protein